MSKSYKNIKKGRNLVRHRKRLLNKIVSIILVFLMIAALFIQPISAEQTSNIAETLDPTSTEENNPIS